MENLVTFPGDSPEWRSGRASCALFLHAGLFGGLGGIRVERDNECRPANRGGTGCSGRLDMPEGVTPPILAPPTSLMGEVRLAALQSDVMPLPEVQNYAETIVRRRLLAVPGIAQVTLVGGGERQYQVWLKPDRLAVHGITVSDVADALRENNANIPQA